MTGLRIPITCLPGPVPPGPLIPAGELARYFDASQVLMKANDEATCLFRQAQEALAEAEQDGVRIRERARRQGIAEAESKIAAIRVTTVDQTVDWLIAERELEVAIAGHLDTHIRALLAQALEEFIGELDGADLILRRLRKRIPQLIADEPFTIRVPPEQIQAVEQAFADQPHMRVTADEGLRPGQAVLETRLVTLNIDLDVHLQSIVSRLRASGNPMS